ncbi:hypothetical protein BGX21_006527, partial [Mortierella sp. AD011]
VHGLKVDHSSSKGSGQDTQGLEGFVWRSRLASIVLVLDTKCKNGSTRVLAACE